VGKLEGVDCFGRRPRNDVQKLLLSKQEYTGYEANLTLPLSWACRPSARYGFVIIKL